jgi:ABC-type uncharacterized transport system fused permease/ATPase subunit
MITVFEDLKKGKYCRSVSKALDNQPADEMMDSIDDDDVDDDMVKINPGHYHGEVVDVTSLPGGEIHDSEYHINLSEVPIITPCGDVVVSKLSFQVCVGKFLLLNAVDK